MKGVGERCGLLGEAGKGEATAAGCSQWGLPGGVGIFLELRSEN